MKKTIRTLRYNGGKSAWGRAEWIAGLLPWNQYHLYCEPFAGMLSVLLARSKVNQELVNDRNHHVVNWFRMVREHPDELGHRVKNMPHSRAEYEWASAVIRGELKVNDMQRALAWYAILWMSQVANGVDFSYCQRFDGARVLYPFRANEVEELSERLRLVQFDCRDAIDVLSDVADQPTAVIYADPPYRCVSTGYAHDVDYAALADVLSQCRGRVAISGYNDDWDELGWERKELNVPAPRYSRSGDSSGRRTEILWVNYSVMDHGRDYAAGRQMDLLKEG